MAAGAQGGVDRQDDDVHVGDPAVGDPGLGAVEHPLVGRLVVDRPAPERADVRPGVGLAHAEGSECDRVVVLAEAPRHPLHDLLGRAVGDDAGHAEHRTEDGQPDPGVAPEQLLVGDRDGQPRRVGERVGDELPRVQPDLGRLLDQRPRRLLPLVPLVGSRPDDAFGKVVDPLLDLELVLVEPEGEIGHVSAPLRIVGRPPTRRSRCCYRTVT